MIIIAKLKSKGFQPLFIGTRLNRNINDEVLYYKNNIFHMFINLKIMFYLVLLFLIVNDFVIVYESIQNNFWDKDTYPLY